MDRTNQEREQSRPRTEHDPCDRCYERGWKAGEAEGRQQAVPVRALYNRLESIVHDAEAAMNLLAGLNASESGQPPEASDGE